MGLHHCAAAPTTMTPRSIPPPPSRIARVSAIAPAPGHPARTLPRSSLQSLAPYLPVATTATGIHLSASSASPPVADPYAPTAPPDTAPAHPGSPGSAMSRSHLPSALLSSLDRASHHSTHGAASC
uniref:Uncharacterized protein n=1 Tax=Arundo donax TaxID=35708 RepID=A0A0A9CIT3_ARUDO